MLRFGAARGRGGGPGGRLCGRRSHPMARQVGGYAGAQRRRRYHGTTRAEIDYIRCSVQLECVQAL